MLVTVAPNRKCLKRYHLSRLFLTFLIFIKHGVPSTAQAPYSHLYDSHHTQLACLINGATMAIDVALARVTYGPVLRRVNKQLKLKECVHPKAH